MQYTSYYNLNKPESTDQINIDDINDNFDTIDATMYSGFYGSGEATEDIVYFTATDDLEDLESGSTLGVLFGKLKRWFTDLKSHGTQLAGLYFGKDSSGNWGYATSSGGDITPFRHPTGNATAAQVLSGMIFSNASSDDITGTMTNRGNVTATISPGKSYTIASGYHAGGGKVTANSASLSASVATYTCSGSTSGTGSDSGSIKTTFNGKAFYTYYATASTTGKCVLSIKLNGSSKLSTTYTSQAAKVSTGSFSFSSGQYINTSISASNSAYATCYVSLTLAGAS